MVTKRDYFTLIKTICEGKERIRYLLYISHSNFTRETKREGSISLLTNVWLMRSHPYQFPSLFLARHTLQRQVCVSSLIVIIITVYSRWERGKPGLSLIVFSAKLSPDVGPQQVLLIGFKWATFRLAATLRNYKTATVRDTNLSKHPHPEMNQFSKRLRSIRVQTILKIPLLRTSVPMRYVQVRHIQQDPR